MINEPQPIVDYTIVGNKTFSDLSSIIEDLNKEELLGFDVETDKDNLVVFMQVYAPSKNRTYIFGKDVFPVLKDMFSMWGNWHVVGHNIQYDLAACKRTFNSYSTPEADTFLLSCSLQEDLKGLKPLCHQYFGFPLVDWETLFGDYDYTNMTEDKWHYIANDPYYTYLLYSYYKEQGFYSFIEDVHRVDIKAMLQYMEAAFTGLQIDQEKFDGYLSEYSNHVSELQDKLDAYAGWNMKVTSTKDVKKLLFEQMELPIPPITTDKGEVSVSKEALSYVPDTDGIVSLILKIKEARSVISAMKNL